LQPQGCGEFAAKGRSELQPMTLHSNSLAIAQQYLKRLLAHACQSLQPITN
jgi:hypothetical protein